MTLRQVIIHLARLQGADIGDEAMIVDGEWSYCVAASIYVSKDDARKLLK